VKLNPFLPAIAILLACAVSPPGRADREVLRKEDVASLIRTIDDLVTHRDIDGLMRHIAPAAAIHITVPAEHGSRAMTLGVKEYRELMQKTFDDAKSYGVHRHDLTIRLLPDGKALAASLVFETIQLGNQRLQTTSHEKAAFAQVDGQIKLISLDAYVLSER
jgi:hypothetical protein